MLHVQKRHITHTFITLICIYCEVFTETNVLFVFTDTIVISLTTIYDDLNYMFSILGYYFIHYLLIHDIIFFLMYMPPEGP